MLKRVILTCNYSPWSRYSGGGQRSAHALGCAYAARDIETHVVYSKARWEQFSVPTVPYKLHWADFAGVRSDGKNPLRALNALSVLSKVRQLLQAHAGQSDRTNARSSREPYKTALHAQGEEGALLHQVAGPTACYVQTPRDSALHDPIAQRTGGRIWVRPKFIALGHGLRHASMVCPTSQSSAQQVSRLFRVETARITVIPNGIAEDFMSVVRGPVAANAPLVYVGRLSRSKGVYELLQSWINCGATPRLWVVGTGPELDEMKARVDAAGVASRVRWLGWCAPEETASLMAQARAVVLPSYEESFGNTMVEAMASGAPLVTTNAGSIPEVVGDPEHAWWAAPEDVETLTRALTACLDDPMAAEKKAEKARAFARATYAWDTTASRYLDVYRAALGM